MENEPAFVQALFSPIVGLGLLFFVGIIVRSEWRDWRNSRRH